MQVEQVELPEAPAEGSANAPERERDLDQHLPNGEGGDGSPADAPGSELRDLQLRVGYQVLRGLIRSAAPAAPSAPAEPSTPPVRAGIVRE
ncbi:MAG: hypothetical protein U0325_10555 [Polyangiales bacterium]